MLESAYRRVRAAGFVIANLDCIVFLEQPKLSPLKDRIRERLSQVLQISTAQVGVKAKTGEGLGAVGREEAIVAQCIALLEERAVNASFENSEACT